MGKLSAFLVAVLALPLISCSSSASEQSVAANPVPVVKQQALGQPVYIQVFKEERTLELYAKLQGKYQLVDSYRICKFSGGLGPKRTEGDLKSPEGFYQATMSQLKPDSRYYQAINIGFPNEFDRAHGYSGKYLMIHGDCVSVGCYAMTDAYIAEIYRYVNSALINGQPAVNISIYPFRMTEKNMQRHRNSSYYSFWKQLQPAYAYFNEYRQAPQVDVFNGQYVVNRPPMLSGQNPSQLAFAKQE